MADHRALGREMGLWTLDPDVGPGLVLWSDRGAEITMAIEKAWTQWHRAEDYRFMRTPHIGQDELWAESGQYTAHDEAIFRASVVKRDMPYLVKPANCPLHMRWFSTRTRSYRDLPTRVAEFGTIYRYERTGALHGLLRVRGISQDDGHIFCTREDAEAEVSRLLELWRKLLGVFGLTDLSVYVGTTPTTDPEWDWNMGVLRRASAALGVPVVEERGGATEYAPRMGARFTDSSGKQWSLPDLQLDTVMPSRLGITYVDARGERRTPVVIHRTVLGSMERFVAVMLEVTDGWLLPWLSPEQVAVIPVSDSNRKRADDLAAALRAAEIRASTSHPDRSVGKRLRECHELRVPVAIVLGDHDGDEVVVTFVNGGERRRLHQADLVAHLQAFFETPKPCVQWAT